VWVARYLSDEWIAELDAAARCHSGLAEATGALSLVIEQVVETGVVETGVTQTGTAATSGEVRWHVAIDHGTVRFVAGPAPDPTVRFTTDEVTARAISTGTATAQGAFMRGTLRVGGDTSALIDHHDVLAGLGDVFAAVPIDD
jgi:hypothetical protein